MDGTRCMCVLCSTGAVEWSSTCIWPRVLGCLKCLNKYCTWVQSANQTSSSFRFCETGMTAVRFATKAGCFGSMYIVPFGSVRFSVRIGFARFQSFFYCLTQQTMACDAKDAVLSIVSTTHTHGLLFLHLEGVIIFAFGRGERDGFEPKTSQQWFLHCEKLAFVLVRKKIEPREYWWTVDNVTECRQETTGCKKEMQMCVVVESIFSQ